MITTIGSNIRLSTMDLSILANNHVSLTTLDNKYSPTALVLPFEGNSRQSQLIHQDLKRNIILKKGGYPPGYYYAPVYYSQKGHLKINPRFRGSTISISISIISTGVNMNHKMRLMEIRRAGYVQEQVTEK